MAVLESRYDDIHHKHRELIKRLAELELRATERDQELRIALLEERRQRPPAPRQARSVAVTRDVRMDEAMCELSRLAPAAYKEWERLLHENERTYRGLPTHSCSVDSHEVARHFASFIAPLLGGTVLDIGCGPQATPSYLDGVAADRIAGIDPLLPYQDHPFAFAQGVAEFLPWEDGTFDLVLAATSLDHVLLLDRTFDEITRVLRPAGHFVAWVAFVEGAASYEPYSGNPTPVDDYHLFHFDRDWFEDVVSKYFDIDEKFHLNSLGSSFYTMSPRRSS